MKLRFLSIYIVLIFATINAQAQVVEAANQPKDYSPFSRYGIGNIIPQWSIAGGAMGGLSAAYRDPFIVNIQNPASLAALKATDFEVGLYAKHNSFESANNKSTGWSGNINHVSLAFPTYSVINEFYDRKPRKLRYSMGLSLQPYSVVGYNIVTSSKAKNADSVTVSNFYLGSGGTYHAQWGHGVAYKGLSIGVSGGFIFGKMNYSRQIELSDNLILPYTANFEDYFTLRGLTYKVGMQYDWVLDPNTKDPEKGNKKHLVFGAYAKPASTFNTNKGSFYRREGIVVDSISATSEILGKGKLPTELAAGVMYEYSNALKVGVEYSAANWSTYSNEAKPETLKDITQFGIGAEFILSKNKLKLDEEKIKWRIGFRTGTDPRSLQGEQLKTQSITAGMTTILRVGRSKDISFLNFGIAYDRLGTSKLKENTVRLTLGFSLNDNSWFLKRRFQ